MLDSNQIEHELERRGYSLEIDNTHARGFVSANKEYLLYVKSSRKLETDPLSPLYKQPLVLHWSIKNSSIYPELVNAVPSINDVYKNSNMRGYKEPENSNTPNGVAVDVDTVETLDKILLLLGKSAYLNLSPHEDLLAAQSTLDKLSETTRKALVDARIGQGVFRKELIDFWDGCAVTGCAVLKLLRASHIKPWRDSDNNDRLNKFNGLLLTANLDQAFDQGLISFSSTGQILIKYQHFNDDDFSVLNIRHDMKLRHLSDEHEPYLAEHRRIHLFEK